MKKAQLVVPILLTGCLSVACGSSGGGKASGPANSAPATPSQPATPSTAAQLKTMLVTAADLPSGFSGAPDTDSDSDSDEAVTASISQCTGIPLSKSDLVQQESSLDFTKGDLDISSDASALRTEQAADNRVAFLKSPKASSCFKSIATPELQKSLPAGSTIDSFDLTITPTSTGPQNMAGEMNAKLTVTAQGQTVDAYLYDAFLTGPLITATIDFENTATPIDGTLRDAVVAKIAKRVAAGRYG